MSNLMKQFMISFSGLKAGLHEYYFLVEDKFFEEMPFSEISKARVQMNVKLNRQSTFLQFDFDFAGKVNVVCDRCADNFDLDIEGHNSLIVRFGETTGELSDEVIVISPAEHEFDISQYVYEFINLALPLHKVHPDDEEGNETCDKEVLEKLKEISAKRSDVDTDPRWDALKKFN